MGVADDEASGLNFMSSQPPSHANNPAGWILVVDDEPSVRTLIAEFLVESPVEVVGAAGGEAALKILDQRTTEPLLTMVDVLMPGMDGLTLTRKLRTRFRHGRLTVMSGHLSDASWWPDDLRDVDFLAKPFRRDDVLERVAAARRLPRS